MVTSVRHAPQTSSSGWSLLSSGTPRQSPDRRNYRSLYRSQRPPCALQTTAQCRRVKEQRWVTSRSRDSDARACALTVGRSELRWCNPEPSSVFARHMETVCCVACPCRRQGTLKAVAGIRFRQAQRTSNQDGNLQSFRRLRVREGNGDRVTMGHGFRLADAEAFGIT